MTGMEVLRVAFPKLHAAMEQLYDYAEELELPEGELREVLRAELARMLGGSWNRAQLSNKTDPISKLALEMDLPIKLARRFAEMAWKPQGNDASDSTASDDRPTISTPLFRVSNHPTSGRNPLRSMATNRAYTTATEQRRVRSKESLRRLGFKPQRCPCKKDHRSQRLRERLGAKAFPRPALEYLAEWAMFAENRIQPVTWQDRDGNWKAAEMPRVIFVR